MAIRTPVSLEAAATFLASYGDDALLALVAVERGTVNTSYEVRLPSRKLFLRLYEEQDEAGARAEAARLAHLAARGVKTPSPLPRKGGDLVETLAGKPAVVFPWREGDMRCLQAVTPADGRRLGEALGELHAAGEDAPRGRGRFEPDDLRVRLGLVEKAKDPSLAALAAPLGERLTFWVARRDSGLPRGLIHGDLFRDNVLWTEDGEISALLDFESASDGALTYDLMVTLLAWSFKDGLDEGIARAIVSGYETVRPLSPAERTGLLAEGAIAALRFTVTRITDEALRALELGRPPRRDKDWRRFERRLACLEALGTSGLQRALLR